MLEPQMLPFIRDTEACFPADAAGLPMPELRRLYDAYAARFTPPRPPGVTAEGTALDLADRRIPLRLYRPSTPPAGIIVYLHGGGFTLGSLDSHDLVTARLAADTGAAVVAVDYRLAPEHRAPAALDDALAVAEAVRHSRLPVPSAPVLLAGDSAGGLLAAGAALALRDRGGPQPAGLVLVYPALSGDPAEPAARDEAEAPLLSLVEVKACFGAYHGDGAPGPYDRPLAAPLHGLPPTFLLPVEHDPLRDDAVLFAQRLRDAGVRVDLRLGRGLVHSALRALGRSPEMDSAFADLVAFVRRHTRP